MSKVAHSEDLSIPAFTVATWRILVIRMPVVIYAVTSFVALQSHVDIWDRATCFPCLDLPYNSIR